MAFARVSLLPACAALVSAVLASAGDVAMCPGEGARYGDFKCNHDSTHRVCAQLLDKQGSPLNWGKGNFWKITGQEAFKWDEQIRQNHGDSWCICMWATAKLIMAAGCENVHINCTATDVAYVEGRYTDGGTDLEPAKRCMQQKCGGRAALAIQQANDAIVPAVVPMAGGTVARFRKGAGQGWSSGSLALAATAMVGAGAISFGAWRRQAARGSARLETQLETAIE